MSEQEKFDELQAQIDALKGQVKAEAPKDLRTQDAESLSMGVRAGTELVGAIVVCGAIGYGLDRWLDTKPWMLILFLFLGICTGFLNVYRVTQNLGSAVGYKKIPRDEN